MSCDYGHDCDLVWDEDEGRNVCPACAAWRAYQHAYHLRLWATASPAERDPKRYAQDMVDAGRGHLLRDDEKGGV